MDPTTRCAHPGCQCSVPDERRNRGNTYCSDYCERHGADQAHVPHDCGCGHPPCGA